MFASYLMKQSHSKRICTRVCRNTPIARCLCNIFARQIIFCAALLLCGMQLLLTAPAVNAQAAGSLQEDSSISGNVVDSLTQQPLMGSEVILREQTGDQQAITRSTVTDVTGHFVFGNLHPGQYVMLASHRGYALPRRDSPVAFRGKTQLLAAHQQVENVVLPLVPYATILGRVFDESGRPLRNISLRAMRLSYQRGERDLEDTAQTSTDESGEYHLAALAPGKYVLLATSSSESAMNLEANPKRAPICYPGTSDLAACLPVSIHNGEETTGINLRFPAQRTVRVAGKVVDLRTSLPCPEARVTLLGDQAGTLIYLGQTIANANGSFQFSALTSGAYSVVAQQDTTSDQEKIFWGMRSFFVENAGLADLRVELAPAMDVKGHIRIQGSATTDLEQMVAALDPISSSALRALIPQPESVSVMPDGSFTIHDVVAGEYSINAFPVPQGSYLDFSGGGIAEDEVPIRPGMGVVNLELALSSGAATIEGTISHASCTGAKVWLVPDAQRPGQVTGRRRTLVDASCRFLLSGVAPGDYKIFALEANDTELMENPELMKQLIDEANPVSALKGSHVVLQSEIAPLP